MLISVMLSAVQYGKASIDIKEDTLTSTVFDGLFNLPNNLLWKIIKKSCYENKLPDIINSIESYDYWPHWDPKGTTKKKYVEPDLFIRFDEFDLIIEAKRWENDQQYEEQWINEFISYRNEYAQDKKSVYLLAIGGVTNESEEDLFVGKYGTIKVTKCRWYNVLETLVNTLDNLNNDNTSDVQNIIRTINYIINGLEAHGFMNIGWLESIQNINNFELEKNIKIINDWKIK